MSLVHGLDGTEAAPDWDPIGDEDLALLARRYPQTLRGARVAWRSPRPFAASALLETPDGTWFVKRHDPRVRDGAALREEHAFLAHLRERGIAVPRVLRDAQGQGALETARGTFEVHERVAGHDAFREAHSWQPVRDGAQARAIGRMLARLHMAAGGFDAPPRAGHPLLAGAEISHARLLAPALDEFLAERPALAGFLGDPAPVLDALAPWHQALVPYESELAPLWAHNDLHASNLSWDAQATEVVAVFDFGLCNRTSALADLATALERNTVAWLEQDRGVPIGRPDLAKALLAGYSEVLPLSSARRAALAAVLPLSHIEFALSEAEYYAGVLRDPARARLAVPGFLQGHLRWFASPEGAEYLAALRG